MRNLLIMALVALLAATPMLAREELVTLPDRDKVSLTIYNSVDLTLVSEERKIAFKKGSNKLSFSWAGTRIDSSSVEFRALGNGGEKLEVLDTTFPGVNSQMLIWAIDAEEAGDYQVEISYFTSGITWGAEYTGILNHDESDMEMTSYLTVTNNSGENYEDAKVRVVIGTINLVQTLDELTKGVNEREEIMRTKFKELRRYNRAMEDSAAEGNGAPAEKKAIVKEGLGEYYIYTVGKGDVTENVPNRWSKRIESFVQQGVPVEKVFTYRIGKGINSLRAVYTFKNDEKHKLGKEPLPGGAIRLYKRKGEEALTFVAALTIKYIPKKEEIKITGDADPRITAKQVVMNYQRKNLDFQASRNNRRYVSGWDEHTTFQFKFANFSKKAIKIEYYLHHTQEDELRAGADTELAKESTTEHKIVFTLEAGAKAEKSATLIRKHGTNRN